MVIIESALNSPFFKDMDLLGDIAMSLYLSYLTIGNLLKKACPLQWDIQAFKVNTHIFCHALSFHIWQHSI